MFSEVKEEEELMEIDDEKTSTLRLLRSPGVILGGSFICYVWGVFFYSWTLWVIENRIL